QWHFIHEAQRNGAHVVAIDPLPTDTAVRCDQHLQLLPGTDGALAMGLMGELLAAGACDEEWLAECAVGWPELRERLADWNAARAAELCGLDIGEVQGLADRMITTRPTAIRMGLGLQRHGGAGAAYRSIVILGAVTGDFRRVGGGVLPETAGRFDAITVDLEEPAGLELPLARTINMSRLAEALTDTAQDPEVHALVVWNTNPAATVPDQVRAQRGFRRDDLHLTVIEQRMTDTAMFADVLMPATMQTEHLDIHPSYGHHYLTLNLPAIDPIGDCLPNTEVFRRLATALGLDHPRLHDSDEDLVRQFIDTDLARERGITFESLSQTGYARVDEIRGTAPHANGDFPTHDGKLHITVPSLAAEGLDPIPGYTPSFEGGDAALAERFPLILISPAQRFFLNSTFADLSGHLRMTGEPTVFLSPEDAAARSIEAGDLVEVANDRGAFTCAAAIHPLARTGVAWSYKAYWAKDGGGNNVNATTPVRDADMGGSPTFHDNRVEVALVAQGATRDDRHVAEALGD
ncbi:MAG: molybdopterin-containing oxidoreductase family protein, partial [Gaiellales bacterium]